MNYVEQFINLDFTQIIREAESYIQGELYPKLCKEPCFHHLMQRSKSGNDTWKYGEEIEQLYLMLDDIQDYIVGYAFLRGFEIAQNQDKNTLHDLINYHAVFDLPAVKALWQEYDDTLKKYLGNRSANERTQLQKEAEQSKKISTDSWPYLFSLYLAIAYKIAMEFLTTYQGKKENVKFTAMLYDQLL